MLKAVCDKLQWENHNTGPWSSGVSPCYLQWRVIYFKAITIITKAPGLLLGPIRNRMPDNGTPSHRVAGTLHYRLSPVRPTKSLAG